MNAFDIHELRWWGWLLWLTITVALAVFRPRINRKMTDEESDRFAIQNWAAGTLITLTLYALMVPSP